ncbi:MAG TPA: ABC transporter ATP-binding protein [Thermoanaerobaculia bacterium]
MIRCRQASFCYRRGEPVLAGVDLTFEPGLTLLLGPNGCGKSTLLKLVAGIEIPDAGSIAIDGHDLWVEEVAARRALAYVPEQPDLTPYATIREILDLVCRLRGEPRERGREALEQVGLRHLADRSVRELSMGQRRRAVLAAALVGAPRHVLLDEPLETLDRAGRDDILRWIDGLVGAGAVVVVVSHDLEPFVERASRALTLRDGRPWVVERLPASRPARWELLEHLARGLAVDAAFGADAERVAEAVPAQP